MDIIVTNLLGTAPVNYVVDEIKGIVAIYDTSYIFKGVLLCMSLWFIYKCLTIVLLSVGRGLK